MDLGYTNVHVLITGASGGIGSIITKLFLEHGARVTAQYNTKVGQLESSDRLNVVKANVTDPESVKQLFIAAGEKFKQEVQILVACHGIWVKEEVDLVDMEPSQWTQTISVNLFGTLLVAREFLRNLRSPRKGYEPDLSKVSMIVMGSTCGEFGEKGHIDYACGSSGLQFGLVRSLKHELVKIAPGGRINAVSPGWVNTPMAGTFIEDETGTKKTLEDTPLKRIAQPIDVANQVLVLASNKVSTHVTGSSILVAGGIPY
ncbi:3-oxoacyl-[acyl-carrier-protein] reductase FabG OS=Vibrio cholerae serotype O1 (strain ATCC 39315 / El Tor Inaba N16961) GN=fabG PE=1 SV=2 [Rhizoctonia solani AG-1 IB]|uniref:3-oxoacyl-[acyl-carrier-protein] reductase FabG n=1 Tax=Thanatephorus cucumeris (strain AG1-IB / isolate 7/3/14) TaxID=1108050 RepID=A0A0B7FCX8_THACB|nr:3-oxoacyl-[acyl-carrier-protein] reductase FabG OS=Vibrio cholerae serotype O1 (strain ATCC 39315 / El Tor Inaba N16961) GN=fabG PE=1 SV=2 [Rhizoctonia solani AG-1 IB]